MGFLEDQGLRPLKDLSYHTHSIVKTPLLQLNSASKSFAKNTVLEDLNLTIERGELILILGTNGAGKTTLLRILAGLLGLTAGELLIDGAPLDRLSETQREKIFFLPDFPALFEDMSVLENVETWLSLYQQEPAARETESVALLDRFGLMEKAQLPASALSRGQRYKLALVLYQGSQAPIGLFDEPFASGMDIPGIRAMRKLLREATTAQRSIIYTTQLASYAHDFADRILVIHESRLYFDGSPAAYQDRLKEGNTILQTFADTDS